MSISLDMARLTPENFRIVAAGLDPGVRPVARESRIDKEWGVLLALLINGEDPPPFASKALTGAPEIIEDADWFHALRLRDPVMTKQLALTLEEIDESELEERYYRIDLSDVYGAPDFPNSDDFVRTRNAFRLLRDFYSAASAAGEAVTFRLSG